MKLSCGKCKRELQEDEEEFDCGNVFCALSDSVLLFGGMMGRRRRRNRHLRNGIDYTEIEDNDRTNLIPDDPTEEKEETPEIIQELAEEDTKEPTYQGYNNYHMHGMTPEEAERMMWEGYGG